MGLEGGTSQYEDIESDKMEEPLSDKSELIGRGYQIQSDTVVSLPSSQEGSTIFGYNVGIRPYQDVIFTIIFLLLILVSASFGIYGVVRSNPDYQRLDFAHYDPSHGCSIPESIPMGDFTHLDASSIEKCSVEVYCTFYYSHMDHTGIDTSP